MSDQFRGWIHRPLGDVVALRTGPFGSALHQSDYIVGGVPVINPTHIRACVLFPDSAVSISAEKCAELADFRLKANDIVMGRRGEMGRCAVVPLSAEGWLCGTGSVIVTPSEAMDARFLQRYLSSPVTVKLLEGDSVGSTMVNLNQKILLGLSIQIPPLAEQRRIADKLDTVLARVDAVNERLARVAPLLKRLRQSVLAAATSGRLTEDWREAKGLPDAHACTLGDLIKVSSGDGLVAKDMRTEGGIPVFGGNGINGYHDQANVNEPTIVIGRVGYYCGSVHLTPQTAWVTDNALKVKFDKTKLSRAFLYFGLLGTDLRQNMSSTAQPVISGQKIYPLPFHLPSLDEQTEIVRRVELLFAYADRLEARLRAAHTATERLTPALLAKAFRGELVPQDPHDEPAAQLLQRLQASQATAAPQHRKARAAPVVQD